MKVFFLFNLIECEYYTLLWPLKGTFLFEVLGKNIFSFCSFKKMALQIYKTKESTFNNSIIIFMFSNWF